jgi:adenosylcobinamide-phosphate synthase
MSVTGPAAVGLSALLDAVFEEYPDRVHPVALFGALVARADRDWRAPRAVGGVIAVLFPLGAAAVVGAITVTVARFSAAGGAVFAGLVLFATTSLRMLLSLASDVVDLTESDVSAARESVRGLVGRDTAALSAAQLRSAAVESVAENLTDGLVAPLLAFAAGSQVSLAAGVAAAVWIKAINTLDSMLGYRGKPVGWASARLDDVVMWGPARLTALLLAIAGASPGALIAAREWAGSTTSPNSGWPMATMAAVLDVRLSKPGAYTLNPGAGLPTVSEARRGIRVAGIAGALSVLLAGVVAWL